ncbi:MAG: proteasome assembly chaperone family protein [Planctomycetota bacterium]|jgi:proteasome assembly chaperone (PAC2) family protein
MPPDQLKILARPNLNEGRMILAFSGWMDGGDVSTGTVEWLIDNLDTQKVAIIDPEGFYIYNFPGSMEVSALFRPFTKIEEGLIKEYQPAENIIYYNEKNNLLLFKGKEPNLNWARFADCIFSIGTELGMSELYFVGSYAGIVPHTREPRLTSSVSNEKLKSVLAQYNINFTSYEGPASFATQLITQAPRRGLQMASLVAEIPSYIQGTNPRSIEAVIKILSALLGLNVNFDELRAMGDTWEQRLNEVLEEKTDLAELINKLEQDYDNEVFDTQMGDLKEWLQRQGIRVD